MTIGSFVALCGCCIVVMSCDSDMPNNNNLTRASERKTEEAVRDALDELKTLPVGMQVEVNQEKAFPALEKNGDLIHDPEGRQLFMTPYVETVTPKVDGLSILHWNRLVRKNDGKWTALTTIPFSRIGADTDAFDKEFSNRDARLKKGTRYSRRLVTGPHEAGPIAGQTSGPVAGHCMLYFIAVDERGQKYKGQVEFDIYYSDDAQEMK